MNAKRHLTPEEWDAILLKHSKMTKEENRAFLRRVMGPPTRKIEGKEYSDTMLLLTLVGPYKETNNQRSITEYYAMGGKEYRLHYFEGEPELEVIEEDDIQQD